MSTEPTPLGSPATPSLNHNTAPPSSPLLPPTQRTHLETIHQYLPTLLVAARSRWLNAYEVLQILQHYTLLADQLPLLTHPIRHPSSRQPI